jgi:hypothetical protein
MYRRFLLVLSSGKTLKFESFCIRFFSALHVADSCFRRLDGRFAFCINVVRRA